MTFAPRQSYQSKTTRHAQRVPQGLEIPCNGTMSALAMAESEELPGCRVPQAVRQNVKELVRQAAESLNPDGLMFLANAAEDAARRKRDQENRA